MGKLYVVSANNTCTCRRSEIERLLRNVSRERQEQIYNYCFSTDKKLGVYGEALVMALANAEAKRDNQPFHYQRGPYGKPYIPELPAFHFNISHTDDTVVVAVSNWPVGVDVEKRRSADLCVAKRFFAVEEQAYIFGTEIGQNDRFFEIWTRKEAYVKYTGKGLTMPLSSFSVFDPAIGAHMRTYAEGRYYISICCQNIQESFVRVKLTEDTIYQLVVSLQRTAGILEN